MSSESPLSADLLDLKLLPAWVKESTEAKRYEHYTGEEGMAREGRRRKRPTPNVERRTFESRERRHDDRKVGRDRRARRPVDRDHRPSRPEAGEKPDRHRHDRHRENRPEVHREAPPPDITIRFLPRTPVFDNVIEQIKSGAVAYSLFHLARLFLEKPERYEVRLAAKPESPLFRLGEDGAVSLNRQLLEQNAFALALENFYKIDITAGEPIKGNFTSVARDPLSGTLLGPTNYHSYQPRLRTLYEQRFSRRMSFSDYQRQIQIVNEPALIERWKEEAQKVTTYTTLREETPLTFSAPADVERHFRSNYLATLVRSVEDEVAIGGVQSRHLFDRVLNRAVEDAWAREIRSPSQMMQELAGRFRGAGLNIFRHRRGMLFVSPIRVRALVHDQAGLSPLVNAIRETLTATPGIGRKELAEKLIVDVAAEEIEAQRLALASDLHWLISEGYVIEFNDGSLDLPREKAKPSVEAAVSAAEKPVESAVPGEQKVDSGGVVVAAAVSAAEPMEQATASTAPASESP